MLPVNSNFNYRNGFYSLCPPWLTTGNAEKYLYTLQLCTDLLLEKANQAIKIRMPGQGDASQIPYLAFDRQLVQGAQESNPNFVVRLQNAFDAWATAGSRLAVLRELQAFLQGLQPGVTGHLPWLTIVGGSYDTVTTWSQLYTDDPIGAAPTLTTVEPSNFNWDGLANPWRAWLVLALASVPTGLSGTGAQTGTTYQGSYQNPGVSGTAVAQSGVTYPGCWIPDPSGTAVNYPFIQITGLSGLTPACVGQVITMSGGDPQNNGTFQILFYESPTVCVIANRFGIGSDPGPFTWSISGYPWIAPGFAYGTPGVNWGQGELQTPPLDYGSNLGGVWQPAPDGASTATTSWGLSCPASTVQGIRALVKTWKSASTYYPKIIFSFGSGNGTSGWEYSPNAPINENNPNGQFGSYGSNQSGVWAPALYLASPFTAYAQGTGSWSNCSVQNVT